MESSGSPSPRGGELSEVKLYRIKGEIRKPQLLEPMRFEKEIPATRLRDALEKIYCDLGSRHRAKRFQIKILEVEEIERGENL
ncbi:50S ribosomal protein L18a [Candidatus Bathyarchaeota archaeon]|nr:MAG: 50S ribosomal protein L18a [Candidatus Bathyarchaeota archaeon]